MRSGHDDTKGCERIIEALHTMSMPSMENRGSGSAKSGQMVRRSRKVRAPLAANYKPPSPDGLTTTYIVALSSSSKTIP